MYAREGGQAGVELWLRVEPDRLGWAGRTRSGEQEGGGARVCWHP